ncbi:aminoglycoside phosphotransferase family protein [Agromyces bauzanensis]
MARLHDDEIAITADDVRRLVATQMPQWRHLEVVPVAESGTDHRLFRLGDALLARMPKIAWAAEQAESDARWLPVLAPRLPLAVPVPLATGAPDERYPFAWSVTPWLPGRALADPLDGAATPNAAPTTAAEQLGGFVRALAAIEAGGPVKTGSSRGVPLARLDTEVRAAIAAAGDRIDGPSVSGAWERAVGAPPHSGPPAWLHGDLLPGNLLSDGHGLTAVLDWGALGLGDPAADLAPAWTIFADGSRRTFRESSGADDAAWARGRGWVLAQATIALPYYWERWPDFAQASARRIRAVLDDRD